MKNNKFLFVPLLLGLFFASLSTARQILEINPKDYPFSPAGNEADTFYGKIVNDPYRWLETEDSEDKKGWMIEQDKLTRELLEPISERKAILKMMKEMTPRESYKAAFSAQGYHYFTKSFRKGKEDQVISTFFRQKGINGSPEQLFSDKAHGAKAHFSRNSGSASNNMKLSPSGRYIAYGIRQGNSLWASWYIFDLKIKKRLPDEIKGLYHYAADNSISWAPNEEGFFYAASERLEKDRPGRQRVYFHRLGDAQADDRTVFEQEDHPDRTYSHRLTRDGHYLVLGAYDPGYNQKGVYAINLKKGAKEVIIIAEEKNASAYFVGGKGNKMIFQTNLNAPFGRLVEVEISKENIARWKTLIPEKKKETLNNAYRANDQLILEYTVDAQTSIKVFDQEGRFLRSMPLPYIGWLVAGLRVKDGSDWLMYEFQGAADPGSIYLSNLQTGENLLFKSHNKTFRPDLYETKYVSYRSKDGTSIPLFLTYKKGIQPDGDNPLWLYAYGRNWAAKPWYQIQHRVWLELGGIYALAHVRGGSEYGQEWQEAGLGLNKQNGIDDLIAAGEWLIAHNYTSGKKLVVNGGSASGPLAGAALTQRPDLFGAALLSYGAYDLIRDPAIRPGSLGIHGDPKQGKKVFLSLLNWSPYHNIKPGTCYPPVFIAHGDRDIGTPTVHSLKMAARLQAAQACRHPILLQLAWGRGHTVGGLEERANQITFLVKTLGLR